MARGGSFPLSSPADETLLSMQLAVVSLLTLINQEHVVYCISFRLVSLCNSVNSDVVCVWSTLTTWKSQEFASIIFCNVTSLPSAL